MDRREEAAAVGLMTHFKIWTEGWNGAGDPKSICGLDAKDAAELFVDRYFSDLGWPKELEVNVVSPDGTTSAWLVEVEAAPVFLARPVRKSSEM